MYWRPNATIGCYWLGPHREDGAETSGPGLAANSSPMNDVGCKVHSRMVIEVTRLDRASHNLDFRLHKPFQTRGVVTTETAAIVLLI